MSKFFTEKETEAWLEMETRDLPMPDGTVRPFTDTKALWNGYDFVIQQRMFTAARLVELSLIDSKETGFPFEMAFPNTVSYAYSRLRKRLGIDDPD